MYGKMFIQDLVRAIPQCGLAKVFSAYLQSELSGFPPESPTEDDGEEEKEKSSSNVPPEEILDDMIVITLKCRLTVRKDIT
jgi:hypothetical protein